MSQGKMRWVRLSGRRYVVQAVWFNLSKAFPAFSSPTPTSVNSLRQAERLKDPRPLNSRPVDTVPSMTPTQAWSMTKFYT